MNSLTQISTFYDRLPESYISLSTVSNCNLIRDHILRWTLTVKDSFIVKINWKITKCDLFKYTN